MKPKWEWRVRRTFHAETYRRGAPTKVIRQWATLLGYLSKRCSHPEGAAYHPYGCIGWPSLLERRALPAWETCEWPEGFGPEDGPPEWEAS